MSSWNLHHPFPICYLQPRTNMGVGFKMQWPVCSWLQLKNYFYLCIIPVIDFLQILTLFHYKSLVAIWIGMKSNAQCSKLLTSLLLLEMCNLVIFSWIIASFHNIQIDFQISYSNYLSRLHTIGKFYIPNKISNESTNAIWANILTFPNSCCFLMSSMNSKNFSLY